MGPNATNKTNFFNPNLIGRGCKIALPSTNLLMEKKYGGPKSRYEFLSQRYGRRENYDVRKMLIRVRNLYLKWISLINGQSIFTEMKTFRLKNVMTPLWPKIVIASSPVSRLLYYFKYFFFHFEIKKTTFETKTLRGRLYDPTAEFRVISAKLFLPCNKSFSLYYGNIKGNTS